MQWIARVAWMMWISLLLSTSLTGCSPGKMGGEKALQIEEGEGAVAAVISQAESASADLKSATDEFAAFRDGAADATPALQAALDRVGAAGGGTVALPAGRYRIEGAMRIPPGITLEGSWTAPHHAALRTGTVLLAYGGRGQADGPPLILLEPGACVRGLTVYYPEQTIEEPTPYPWAIQGRGMHCTIENVTLVNPWRGIDFSTHWNELHLVRNVFGCPLKTGLFVDGCSDIGRIENVHFNPHYWFRDEGDGEARPHHDRLMDWLVREGEGFVFGRTDWEYVLNTFCYGYRSGYRFIRTEKGECNGNFLGIGGDGCRNAVDVEAAAPYGILITNGEFVGLRAEEPVQVAVGPKTGGVVQFNNCAFWGPAEQIARIEGGAVSFLQCNFHYWDAGNRGRAAIEARGGALILQNCLFHRAGLQFRLGPKIKAAVIAGNLMKGGLLYESEAPAKVDVQIANNAFWP